MGGVNRNYENNEPSSLTTGEPRKAGSRKQIRHKSLGKGRFVNFFYPPEDHYDHEHNAFWANTFVV